MAVGQKARVEIVRRAVAELRQAGAVGIDPENVEADTGPPEIGFLPARSGRRPGLGVCEKRSSVPSNETAGDRQAPPRSRWSASRPCSTTAVRQQILQVRPAPNGSRSTNRPPPGTRIAPVELVAHVIRAGRVVALHEQQAIDLQERIGKDDLAAARRASR